MPYVYSTLATDIEYTGYVQGGGDIPRVSHKVLVLGGAGVAGPWTRLQTPRGVATEVSDSDAEFLEQHVIFQRHKLNGFVKIDAAKYDPEQVAADMTGRDESAPLVDADFVDPKVKAPTHTGKGKR